MALFRKTLLFCLVMLLICLLLVRGTGGQDATTGGGGDSTASPLSQADNKEVNCIEGGRCTVQGQADVGSSDEDENNHDDDDDDMEQGTDDSEVIDPEVIVVGH
ncbi:unnamed protein product [Ilex paraguariensis]|uniref:Uncharacterized protein n=1 Tax=Ilex paraguariensis TaxID=185542 RepID=A0ABC8TDV3_9AQUA